MPAACRELIFERGATFRQPLRFREADGSYRDLSEWTGRMHVRAGLDADAIFLELTTAGGRIIMDADGWIILTVAATDTAELEQLDGLVYDLEIESPDGEVIRVLEGTVYVKPEVTR